MNSRTRLFGSAVLFMACCGMALGGEAVTVQGKIEKIDLTDRRIVITPRGKDDKIELELTRKTTIKRDGKEDVGLDTIKPGDNAKIKYDSELLVAAIIELGEMGPTEALNLEELNGSGDDFAPTLTSDGLEIFWAATADGEPNKKDYRTSHIHFARRKNPDAFFVDKKKLFSGHSPVLSSDGLQMIFRSADGAAINLAIRKERTEDFGRPRPIPSLAFPGRDANPRWLSEDGLTLYFDMIVKEDNGPAHTLKVTRANLNADWGKPTQIDVKFEGQAKDFRINQVSSSADDLHLMGISIFTPAGSQRVIRLGILSRSQPSGPYTQWQAIPLTGSNGQYPFCLRPRFIQQTNELFLVSSQLFLDPKTAEKRGLDLWVIKDFALPK